MVRLVFRPYTQIRRSICTSEPLRASTRVSSGFTLSRYSSPSFGSQQPCSTQTHPSTSGSVDNAPAKGFLSFTFIPRWGFCTQTLAWTLDSLVRVSRRATCNHYASILKECRPQSREVPLRQAITTEAYILDVL